MVAAREELEDWKGRKEEGEARLQESIQARQVVQVHSWYLAPLVTSLSPGRVQGPRQEGGRPGAAEGEYCQQADWAHGQTTGGMFYNKSNTNVGFVMN